MGKSERFILGKPIDEMSINPSETHLAVGSQFNIIKIYNIETGYEVSEFKITENRDYENYNKLLVYSSDSLSIFSIKDYFSFNFEKNLDFSENGFTNSIKSNGFINSLKIATNLKKQESYMYIFYVYTCRFYRKYS